MQPNVACPACAAKLPQTQLRSKVRLSCCCLQTPQARALRATAAAASAPGRGREADGPGTAARSRRALSWDETQQPPGHIPGLRRPRPLLPRANQNRLGEPPQAARAATALAAGAALAIGDGFRHRTVRGGEVRTFVSTTLPHADSPAARQLRDVAARGPDVVPVVEGVAAPALGGEVLRATGHLRHQPRSCELVVAPGCAKVDDPHSPGAIAGRTVGRPLDKNILAVQVPVHQAYSMQVRKAVQQLIDPTQHRG
mmetsp:Transcript_108623/g.346793  ORF Transcript_108623/g.346793 Transcript_108623/m.346793 type:complete len:255 (+) Transcript_108623:317-1081(+)